MISNHVLLAGAILIGAGGCASGPEPVREPSERAPAQRVRAVVAVEGMN